MPKQFYRKDRVSELIRKNLAEILLRNIEVDGALITLTEVDVNKDLDRAISKISVIPSEKSDRVLEVLEKSRGYLQGILNDKINIRPMPKIVFKIDVGPEKAAGVEKKLLEDK